MTYSVEKLATIFGCTVIELINIETRLLWEKIHPVALIPELVAHILSYIPTKDFGPHIVEINPVWYAVAEDKLWKEHEVAEKLYEQAVIEFKEAEEIVAYCKADKKKYTTFAGQVAIEKALLRCEFVTQESDWEKWTQMTYDIKLLSEGRTPDDEDDEEEEDEFLDTFYSDDEWNEL